MGPLIGLMVAALAAFVVLAVLRGRMVSIALAGSECPDCRIPLVRVPDVPLGPRAWPADDTQDHVAQDHAAQDHATPGGSVARGTWEVWACPECDRVVTTVGRLPSPLAECPACHQPSLVVYAERAEALVVVDEWCDLCGRRGRTTLEAPRGGPVGGSAPSEGRGRVLPFKRG